MTMFQVGLVTCQVLPEPDPDEQILLNALRKAGVDAQLIAWDDPQADPAAFDLCVLRSCWNYFEAPDAFLAWMQRAAKNSRLLNAFQPCRWNLHKRYLLDLQNQGLPIVPSSFLDRGAPADLASIAQQHGWRKVVVKPCISAGSFATQFFDLDQFPAGQKFLQQQLQLRDMMVQKFMPSVQDIGERALIWIDGEFTHSVVKSPRYAGDDEQVSAAQTISAALLAVGQAVVALPQLNQGEESLLYARVDLIEDENGAATISEFELLEPSLFLMQSPTALKRLVTGIVRQVQVADPQASA
jgi:SAM-dependent methyltransferase